MKPTLILAVLALVACSTTTEGTGTSSSSSSGSSTTSGTSSSTECQLRCMSKAKSCGDATPDSDCQRLCSSGFTASQLTCLETKSCSELETASSLSSLCPGATSSSSTSTSSSGGAGSPCNDFTDCHGIAYCQCASGQKLGSWECTSSTCIEDCSFACQ